MVRLGSSSSSSRRSSRRSGSGRTSAGSATHGASSSSGGRNGRSTNASNTRTSTGRPRLSHSGKSRNLLLEPTSSTAAAGASSSNHHRHNTTKESSKPTKSSSSKDRNETGRNARPNDQTKAAARADPKAEVDRHALRRLHRHERTLDIPTTLSIVPFPSTPHVDPTHLEHSAGTTTTTTTSTSTAGHGKAVAHHTPYGGRRIAGTTAEPTPGTTGGTMRRADAGHTPGGIYLPPALLPSTSTTIMGVHTHLPTAPWDDGVSPLAFGAEARPVRTEREQQAMEEEERRRRKERERRRGALLEYNDNGGGGNVHNEDGEGGTGKAKKGNAQMKGQTKKGNKGRRGKSQGRSKSGGGQKRSEAYEVNADGLLVVKSSKSSDSGGSSGSGSGSGASSGATKSKSKARAKARAKAGKKKSSLRTLGKAGIRSLRRGGAKSRKATIAAAIVVKTKVVTAMNHGDDGDDDNDNDTIRRSKSNDGSLKTPAMPAEMAHRVDDGEAVAPYSALAPTATTSTSHTPVRHQRQPVPLHNFRRLSMIDLRDVASEQLIPTTVKRRVAAAKAKAVAAGSAGIAAGAVGGSAAATLAYEGARVGGARVVGSAKKVGRSATKSMARLRRRIVDNVNAAGYAGERRLFGDDGEEIVDIDVDEMAEDIEEEIITNDFCSYGPDDEDVGSLVGGGGRAIGATRNPEGPKVDLSALNDTFTTLDRSVAAAGGKNNDFSILWGASEPPTSTKSSRSGESDSLEGTRMISSATNADGEDGAGFFDGIEEKVTSTTADAAKAAMPREGSFTYSYSPFNDTLRADGNDKMQQSKAGNDLNLTGFLEEPFRGTGSGEDSSENDDDEKVDDDVSPEFTPFVANVNSNGAEAASTNDESMSIATPAIHLCRHFDTALSISGKPKGAAVGRMPSSATLSSGSSLSSGRPPMARLSTGRRSMSSGSRVSSLESVQSSAASQTISLMTPMDKHAVAGYSATPLRTATKEDIKPLLGDLESPMSGASELLLPSPSPEKNKSAAVSLSSASGHSHADAEEDASAFIETVVSELIEEDKKEASIITAAENEKESAGPPSLINSDDDDDVASRSTLTHSIVSAGAKQQKTIGSHAVVVKEDTDEGKTQMVVATTGGSFALVPSTYVFTPMDQRQPALTKEAMQNASFLFSPNNMGRVAIQRKIAEKKATRKQRSALERYSAGLRTSTEQTRIGYSRDSFPVPLGDVGSASKDSPSTSSLSSIGTASLSKSQSEAHVSFRVSPESAVATPAPHDENARAPHVESTSQPIVSPSESAVSSASAVPTKSMVEQSAVTPWKTSSPFTRFNNAKKIFGKEKKVGERIESLVSSDEDDAKQEASETSSTSSDNVASTSADGHNHSEAPDDELESFVSAVSHVTPSLVADAEAKCPAEEIKTMVAESAVTPFKTNSPAIRFHENKKKLQKATAGHAQNPIPKLTTMSSATSHAGRLRRNRMVTRKNPRRETGGSGVLAPHRSNLVNPMFASQPLIEDEVTVYSENPSVVPSAQQSLVTGDEEQSTISSVLSIARECVALSSASVVRSVAATESQEDSDSDDAEDDFSLALKSTTSTVATAKNDRRLSKENNQRSVRWSASTRAADAAKKKPSWAGANSSRSIVLADSFDEESLASSQYTTDKENMMTTPSQSQPRLAQGKTGLVNPRRMPNQAALCLSPSARTPMESRRWRELANSANSKNSNTSSAKKLLSSGKKRLSSSKKRLSSSGKKKAHTKHTPMKAQLIQTGKHTPLRVHRDNWENKVNV